MVAEPTDIIRHETAARPRASLGRGRGIATAAALAVAGVHLAVAPWWPGTMAIAVACLAVAFVTVLRAPDEHPLALGLLVAAFAVVLHGTMIAHEGQARFPTTWLHAGYTAHVMEHHDVLPDLGARFSWPAFFVVTAAALSSAGAGVPEPILRFAPLFFVLACLPAVLVIARRCLGDMVPAGGADARGHGGRPGVWRVPWLAVWIFPAINWLGQDYFAPQAMAFLLGLCIVALVLTLSDRPPSYWRPSDGLIGRGSLLWPRRPGAEDTVIPRTRTSQALLLVGTFVVLCAAVAMSHQLTPFVIALQLAVLWYSGRLPWILPAWIVGITALVWVSWGASDFWIPFLGDVFGGVGNPVGNVAAGIAERAGGSPEHQIVVGVRIGFAAAVAVAALFGVCAEFLRDRRVELSLPLLAAAPALLVLAQSYGGEGVLRIFLFASPFLAMLIAKMLPVRATMGRTASAAVVVASVALVAPFLVARYGNEPFERVTPDDVALASCMYDRAPEGATLLSVSPHLAWQFRDVADHRHLSANERVFDAETADDLLTRLDGTPTPWFVIISEPQLHFVTRSLGAPERWAEQLQRDLATHPAVTPVCANPAGVVYRVEDAR